MRGSHFPISTHTIRWLAPPDATVLAALKADFGLGPPPEVVNPPALRPVTLTKQRQPGADPKRRRSSSACSARDGA